MRQSPKHAIFFASIITLAIILLAGCATPNSVNEEHLAKNIKQNVAYNFQYGQAAVINPGNLYLKKNDQLALMPGGPYIYQQFSLENPPVDITTHHQFAYVITQAKDNSCNLLVIHFPKQGRARLVSTMHIGRSVIKLRYADNRILLADKTGLLELIDVTNPRQPVKLSGYKVQQPIQDIQFNGKSAYVLQNNKLSHVKFSGIPSGKIKSSLSQQWQLPLHAISFAVRGNTMWTTGPDGVGVIRLSNKAALTDMKKTTGSPVDIQLFDKLALITDVKGGLVVFDVSSKEKLQWVGSYNKRSAINRITLKRSQSFSSLTKNASQDTIVAALDNGTIMSIGLNNPQLPSSGPVFKSYEPVIAETYLSDDVLIATRHAIQRVVMKDAGNYSISPEGTNQGGSRRGVIRNNILYVADWFSGLHLYDISIPQQLRHLSNYHTPGSSKGVALYDDYVLIGDDDQGLQIVDVRDPLHPTWVSELSPDAMARQGLAYTMKRVGNLLYLADHRGGFHIIDLADIHHPKHLGGFDTPGKSWGIEVFGKYVFVADDQDGLLIFDASDVTNPKLVTKFDPGGQAEDVAIQGNRAYVVFFDKGLYVLDINNPHQPRAIAHTPIPGNARGIELTDEIAYVTGWESGLHILDIKGTEAPRIISSFDTDGSAWGVNTKNGFAYVLDWWGGIKVLDVRDPTNPAYVGQYHARGTLQRLRARNRYLYAASGSAGLQVFDMKNPLNPIWITGIDMEGQAQDIWHDDSRAYVAAGDGGVVIMDTLDPFYTRRVGQIDTPGLASVVRTWNDILFIADSRAGTMVVDTRNPQHPQEINRFPITTHDLWIDDRAFWAATESGLSWWRHDSKYQADNRHDTTIPGGVDWIRTQDDSVITAQRNGLVQVWRLTSLGLTTVSEYQAGEPILDVQIDSNSLYLLGEKTGLMVIDIHNPATPRLIMAYPGTGLYTGIEIAGGAAFFSGENKLASVTLLPGPHYVSDPAGDLNLQLPANLPVGSYHLLTMQADGQKQLFPNAVNIHRSSNSPSRPILEKYRQMLNISH